MIKLDFSGIAVPDQSAGDDGVLLVSVETHPGEGDEVRQQGSQPRVLSQILQKHDKLLLNLLERTLWTKYINPQPYDH